MEIAGKSRLVVLFSAVIAAAAAGPALSAEAGKADATMDLRLKAVAANPNEPRNHYNLGVEYYNREMLNEAASSFQKALSTNRGDKEAHAAIDMDCLQTLGVIALTQNRFSDAAKWFRDGLKRDPTDATCQFRLGQALYYAHDFGGAKEALNKFIAGAAGNAKLDKDAAQALELTGAMANEEKKYAEAADAFRTLMNSYPAYGKEARKNLSVVLLTQGDGFTKRRQPLEAVKYYDEAASVNSSDPASLRASARAHYELGMAANASSKPEEKKLAPGHFKVAAANFHKATILDPKDFESAYFEGLSRYYLEQFTDMISAYQKAISINPSHGGARYNLALALYRQGVFDDARKEADEAVKLQPGDPASNQLVVRIHDASIEDLLKKGTEAYTAERLGEAIQAWEKVLTLDPHNPEAKQYLDQATTKVTQAVQDHLAKGQEAYDNGDLETAFSEWSAASALDPANAAITAKLAKVGKMSKVSARRKLAQAAWASGDAATALSELDAALALNPRDAKSLKLRKTILSAQKKGLTSILASARTAMKAGKLGKAMREALKAKDLAGTTKEIGDLLITIGKRTDEAVTRNLAEGAEALRKGNRSAARSAFEAVLALDPANKEASTQIKSLTGKESKVAADAEKFKEFRKKGINAYLMGRLEEAKKAWIQALDMDPENAEIKRYLERVKLKLKGTGKGKTA